MIFFEGSTPSQSEFREAELDAYYEEHPERNGRSIFSVFEVIYNVVFILGAIVALPFMLFVSSKRED